MAMPKMYDLLRAPPYSSTIRAVSKSDALMWIKDLGLIKDAAKPAAQPSILIIGPAIFDNFVHFGIDFDLDQRH
jgi:hypothetical protein